MRTNFVLIDAENVKPESLEKLKHEYFRVMVFVGTNQKRLDTPIVMAIHSLGSHGSYVQIGGNGPNALDFHIAYYIGKLSAENQDAYFHIISEDKGFDPLIKHLKEQHILCSRCSSVSEIPIVKRADALSAKERATDFYENRIALAHNRPPTVTSLTNAIQSHFYKQFSPEEAANVVNALQQLGLVSVKGKKVAYTNEAPELAGAELKNK